ncbi:MAG: tetratricopeptide repeat protein, partial [Candidatus Latescibacterota bacterium]
IRGIGVISRQSAAQYKDKSRSIKDIGSELGVDYVLEGTVQRERPSDPTSRVRVIPQLVRVSDDVHVWADTFDDEMTAIFRVQSEIAEQVATALDVALIGADRRSLAKSYTDNIEAYEYYLRGEENSHVLYDENVYVAAKMFEKAIELDRDFALAWAGLSMVRSWLYFSLSQKHELPRAKAAADRALELDPDLPEAHTALGFYYYRCLRDYGKALRHLAEAQKRRPSDERVIRTIAHVYRRDGLWDKAVNLYEKAQVLNPREFMTHYSLGQTYRLLREYEKAEPYLTRAVSLSPRVSIGYLEKEALYLSWDGNTERAQRVLRDAFRMIGPSNLPGRYYSAVTRILHARSPEVTGQLDRIFLGIQEDDTTDYYFNKAAILEQMGRERRSIVYYDSLRVHLEALSKREQAVDPFLDGFLGLAYAKLGQAEDAVRHGEAATENLPVPKDAVLGPYLVAILAAIYTEIGEHDKAVAKLDNLLSIPGDLSVHLLRLDPIWDPLRDHPRFARLVAEEKNL